MTALQTVNLTKRFGNVVAVDALNVTINDGEVFGFLGPNGAGKSTTIDMLLDFIRPTEGHASVLGHDPQTESRAIRERIGILPEGYGLYDRLPARKHVTFAIEIKESQDDPDAILERVGLAQDARRTVGNFSKGMRQRLALGLALVDAPDLLILDEPSSGLDPSGAREMREIVREERDRGATVFFSSHIMREVDAVCDRVGIMNEGQLVAVDTIDGLRDSAGAEFALILSVDEVPESHDLFELDGVTDVTVNDSSLRVECSDSSVKAPVISRVEATGTRVTDIEIEETDLEDIFTEYTSNENAQEAEP